MIKEKAASDAAKQLAAEERKLRAQEKAEQAKQILNSSMFKGTMEDIGMAINREMDIVDTTDHMKCADLVMQRQVCNRIIRHLVAVAKGGKVEAYNAQKAEATA